MRITFMNVILQALSLTRVLLLFVIKCISLVLQTHFSVAIHFNADVFPDSEYGPSDDPPGVCL